MATKNTSTENPTADSETPLENHVVVPHQSKPKADAVQAEPNEDETTKENFVEKVKKTLTNKKVVAGVASVALIAVGAFVVRNRSNDTMEDETTSD